MLRPPFALGRRPGAPRGSRARPLQGRLAQRRRPCGHERRQVPRQVVRPRTAAGVSHDQVLRCVRKSPPSPASHHCAVPTPGQQLALGLADFANDKPDDDTESSPRPRRLVWAKLLARVFAVDVTVCRKCPPRGPRATPAPSSRTGLVVPRLTARSRVALTPACPLLGRGGRGARFRALPSCNTSQYLTTEAVRGRAPCSPLGPHPSTIAHRVRGPPPKFLPETS